MDITEALRERIAPDQVITDPAVLESYRRDQAAWADSELPAAVVRARSTDDVVAVVQICLEYGAPVVARGAGTGLSGGANAVAGCVVLAMEQLNQVLEIDPLERIAVVQPGVVNDDLRAAVAEQGLWYPPDPASAPWSTIGGNVATNAGGLCCVKYGVTREYVLGLQFVNGAGELVRVGRRTAKGVAGLDLTALMVGSEGTLGIITEITLKLLPARPPERTVAGFFDKLTDAGEAIAGVARSGVIPSVLELVDSYCLKVVDDWKNMGLSADANYILLANTDAPGAAGEAEAKALIAAFEQAGATWAGQAESQEEADALFAARRLAYPALERLGPVLTEDVCVPKGNVPAMLARVEQIAEANDVVIATIAHAGDGNLHPCMVTSYDDDSDMERRCKIAFEQIIDAALELGGTVTGEHGVGLLKMPGLAVEVGEPVLAMYRAVKAGLDPQGIFNPGKVF